MKEALNQLREVHAIQGRDGFWDINDYMFGLYNGLELALSIVENRECRYKQRPKPQPEQEPVAETMRQMLEVQGQHGNWNYDSYMHGLYNGMEYMVALAEKREPKFKDAPEVWLAKYEVKRNNFSNTESLTEVTTPPQLKKD